MTRWKWESVRFPLFWVKILYNEFYTRHAKFAWFEYSRCWNIEVIITLMWEMSTIFWVWLLECKVCSLSMKNLILLLGTSFKAKSVWNEMIKKIEHRLATMKRLHLSKGSWTTLINKTLPDLPTHFLFLLPLLASIVSRIEKLQHEFL